MSLVITSCAFDETDEKPDARPPTPTVMNVTVCDLLDDPSRYDSAVVRVTGTYMPHFHGALLFDSTCHRGNEIAVCTSTTRFVEADAAEPYTEFVGSYVGRFYEASRCRAMSTLGRYTFALDSVIAVISAKLDTGLPPR